MVGFLEQAKLTKSKSYAKLLNKKFIDTESPLDQSVHQSGQYGTKEYDINFIKTDLNDPSFKDFVNQGYESEKGYSIRINPRTGQKEMFVAGTRNASQWGLNLLDTVLYSADKGLNIMLNDLEVAAQEAVGIESPTPMFPVDIKMFQHIDVPRNRKQQELAAIAEENDVEVIYGHSRGGAMVSDMDVSAQKIGLDAAMLIAHNKDTLNINEGGGINPLGLFDEIIGVTGKNNYHYDASTWSPHRVWRT